MRGSGVGSAGQAQSLLGATVTPTPEYRTMPLARGEVAMIDATDYDWLSQWKWSLRRGRSTLYAFRQMNHKTVYLHRAILDAPFGMKVDHINGNGLDNRRCNLRLATSSQNAQNSRIRRNNKTGVKGVYFHVGHGDYKAKIKAEGRCIWLGSFASFDDAAKARREAEILYHGEFVRREA